MRITGYAIPKNAKGQKETGLIYAAAQEDNKATTAKQFRISREIFTHRLFLPVLVMIPVISTFT